jgi:repressor LexA
MIGMTARQSELLDFLKAEAVKGKTPSFTEMKDHMGLASKAGIHRIITALEERGCIRRMTNRARAIEVVNANALAAFTDAQLRGELSRRAALRRQSFNNSSGSVSDADRGVINSFHGEEI